jgi:hypothetical protein
MSSHLIFVIGGWNGIDFYVAFLSFLLAPLSSDFASPLSRFIFFTANIKLLKVYARNNKAWKKSGLYGSDWLAFLLIRRNQVG